MGISLDGDAVASITMSEDGRAVSLLQELLDSKPTYGVLWLLYIAWRELATLGTLPVGSVQKGNFANKGAHCVMKV